MPTDKDGGKDKGKDSGKDTGKDGGKGPKKRRVSQRSAKKRRKCWNEECTNSAHDHSHLQNTAELNSIINDAEIERHGHTGDLDDPPTDEEGTAYEGSKGTNDVIELDDDDGPLGDDDISPIDNDVCMDGDDGDGTGSNTLEATDDDDDDAKERPHGDITPDFVEPNKGDKDEADRSPRAPEMDVEPGPSFFTEAYTGCGNVELAGSNPLSKDPRFNTRLRDDEWYRIACQIAASVGLDDASRNHNHRRDPAAPTWAMHSLCPVAINSADLQELAMGYYRAADIKMCRLGQAVPRLTFEQHIESMAVIDGYYPIQARLWSHGHLPTAWRDYPGCAVVTCCSAANIDAAQFDRSLRTLEDSDRDNVGSDWQALSRRDQQQARSRQAIYDMMAIKASRCPAENLFKTLARRFREGYDERTELGQLQSRERQSRRKKRKKGGAHRARNTANDTSRSRSRGKNTNGHNVSFSGDTGPRLSGRYQRDMLGRTYSNMPRYRASGIYDTTIVPTNLWNGGNSTGGLRGDGNGSQHGGNPSGGPISGFARNALAQGGGGYHTVSGGSHGSPGRSHQGGQSNGSHHATNNGSFRATTNGSSHQDGQGGGQGGRGGQGGQGGQGGGGHQDGHHQGSRSRRHVTYRRRSYMNDDGDGGPYPIDDDYSDSEIHGFTAMPPRLPFETRNGHRSTQSRDSCSTAISSETRFTRLSDDEYRSLLAGLRDTQSLAKCRKIGRYTRVPAEFKRYRELHPRDEESAKCLAFLYHGGLSSFSRQRARMWMAFAEGHSSGDAKSKLAIPGHRESDLMIANEVAETVKFWRRLKESRVEFKKALDKLVASTAFTAQTAADLLEPLWLCFEKRDQDVMDVLDFNAALQIRMTAGRTQKWAGTDNHGGYHAFGQAVIDALHWMIEQGSTDESIIAILRDGDVIKETVNGLSLRAQTQRYIDHFSRKNLKPPLQGQRGGHNSNYQSGSGHRNGAHNHNGSHNRGGGYNNYGGGDDGSRGPSNGPNGGGSAYNKGSGGNPNGQNHGSKGKPATGGK